MLYCEDHGDEPAGEGDVGQFQSLDSSETDRARGRGPRDEEDDFFCLRFGVWYPSVDCAYRTRHRSCPGCLDCEQGRFNLARHRLALARSRHGA